MHLYSDQPLIKKINWTILQGANLVAEFSESPRIAKISDGMQYARLIGSSSYLVPLAAQMPTSIASKAGFIDKKYSIVALEEDSLPASIARFYENHGVPELAQGDIFASSDEHLEPVAQWLTDHPPHQMNHDIGGIVVWNILVPVVARAVFFDDFVAGAAVPNPDPVPANQAVRMALPLQAIYTTSSTEYPDYSDALSVVKTGLTHASSSSVDVVTVKNGFLVINSERLKTDNGKPVEVSLFDCFGRTVGHWSVSAVQSRMIPLPARLAHGVYMARITCGTTMIVRPVAIR
jgi:hypothetical protein